MDKWQDIASAPTDGTIILLWGVDEDEWEDSHDEPREPSYHAWPARQSIQPGIWWMAGGMMRRVLGATHWLPLPTPPETTA